MNEVVKDDARIEQLRSAFHNWKHENEMTQLVFKYFKEKQRMFHAAVINNAASPAPVDHKLYNYYAYTAKLALLTEIMELDLDAPDFQESILDSK